MHRCAVFALAALTLTGCAGVPTATGNELPTSPSRTASGPALSGWSAALVAARSGSSAAAVSVVRDGLEVPCDQYSLVLPPESAKVFRLGSCQDTRTNLEVIDRAALLDESALVTRIHDVPPPQIVIAGSPDAPRAQRTCAAEVRPYLLGDADTVTFLTPGRFELRMREGKERSAAVEYWRDGAGTARPSPLATAEAQVREQPVRRSWLLTSSSPEPLVAADYEVLDRASHLVVLKDRAYLACDGTTTAPQVPLLLPSLASAFDHLDACHGPTPACTLHAAPGPLTFETRKMLFPSARFPAEHWRLDVPPAGGRVLRPASPGAQFWWAGGLIFAGSVTPILAIRDQPVWSRATFIAAGGAMFVTGMVLSLTALDRRPEVVPLQSRYAFGVSPVRDGAVAGALFTF